MRRIVILLCILSLVLCALACNLDWDQDKNADRDDTGQTAVEAILTAQAAQLYAQETAIAPFGPQVDEP
jgi:hypothetical protein